MADKKVLFISGSFGLGHATRDLALATELRKQNPTVEISWIASEPASNLLEEAGEKLLPEAKEWANENITAENAAQGLKLNLNKFLINIRDDWKHNVDVFKKVINGQSFDLVIGDETYEIMIALKRNPSLKTMPFVMIYDFVGTGAMTKSLMDQFSAYYWNRFWSKDFHKPSPFVDIRIFLGELEDIPDTKFGYLLPRRRDWAIEKCKFVGYMLPFKPNEFRDKKKLRAKLGYGDEPLVICSIGGTAVGKEMLELCARSYPIVRKKIHDLRMVLVCGPRLVPEYLRVEDRIEVKGYVPRLYEHLAASNLAVVQSGGTTTIELTALKKPFLYLPLIDHFEQRVPVSYRLTRHKAGMFMDSSTTTPQSLADAIVQNIDKQPDYADIPTDGAQKAAELIGQLL